jgi:polyisoprenoid-binding protein YceI
MTNPVATAVSPSAQPGCWAARPADCIAAFTVRNLGLRPVTGTIPVTVAELTVGSGGHPARLHAELDVRGLDTGSRRRDRDLRRPRFLGTGQWPVMTFTADDIRPHGDGWTVHGTLAVKDTSCPVQLDVAAPRVALSAAAGPVQLRAAAQFDRRAAGVTAGPALLIGHLITVTLTIRLQPPQA